MIPVNYHQNPEAGARCKDSGASPVETGLALSQGAAHVPRFWLNTAVDAVGMTESVAGASSLEAQLPCPEGAL